MHKLASLVTIAALMAMSDMPFPAASAQSGIKVVIDPSISITAPALLDFGHGVPYAVLHAADNDGLTVTSNNQGGYIVTLIVSNMVGDGAHVEIIPNTDFSIAMPGETLDVAGNGVISTTQRSNTDGDHYSLTSEMNVPFVESATYTGTADFVAQTQ